MRYRQVHIDFHTSEAVPGIGEKFDKKEFQQALKEGHVDSVTVFSKCHHGWAYHPSKANEMHPNLKFDLLKAQIEAAHEIGVKTPVYLSAGIDEKMSRRHPEWLIRKKDESLVGRNFTHVGFHQMCLNSPYLEYLAAQVEEVCENYDADGIFMDITGAEVCYCQNCVATLMSEGKDPYDEKNAIELAHRVHANYTKRIREAIDKHKKGLPVFHNGGHIARGRRDLAHENTHLELESLPTGGWGYDHFPLSAAYARNLDMDFLGMTGKFHSTWGEFGGFKHPNALRYEAALAVANGARMSIGDQLHPSGKADMATYKLIGTAYKEIEEIEPWLKDAHNVADVALLSYEAVYNYFFLKNIDISDTVSRNNNADTGCSRILLEGKYLFDVIDTEMDFDKYKLIILPDRAVVDEELAAKLKKYTSGGGKLLATGKSGVYYDRDEFAFDFGADFRGECYYQPSYLYPCKDLRSLLKSAYIMFSTGYSIENKSGEIIGYRENSYFNRSLFAYCSHVHTPNDPDNREVGAVLGRDGAYISWEMFEDYALKGSITVKEFLIDIIDTLLGKNKTFDSNLPSQGIATLTKQNDRYINHIIYAAPVKRGTNVEVIEDIIPLYDTRVTLKLDMPVKRVYKAPQMQEIPFTYEDGIISYTIDKFECSQLVVIE